MHIHNNARHILISLYLLIVIWSGDCVQYSDHDTDTFNYASVNVYASHKAVSLRNLLSFQSYFIISNFLRFYACFIWFFSLSLSLHRSSSSFYFAAFCLFLLPTNWDLPNGIFSVTIVWPWTMLNAVSSVMMAHSITMFVLILLGSHFGATVD